jgi:hypothetical protein
MTHLLVADLFGFASLWTNLWAGFHNSAILAGFSKQGLGLALGIGSGDKLGKLNLR